MPNQNDYKNRYRDNPNRDALTNAFRPKEAECIRKYVKQMLSIKQFQDKPEEFEIRRTPPRIPVDDLDIYMGRKLEGNLVKEGSFELLQSIIADWWEEENGKPLTDGDFEERISCIKDKAKCNFTDDRDFETLANILIHLLECLSIKKASVNDLIQAAWKIHRKNVENRKNDND